MIIGILKEIKTDETRVAITPSGVEVMLKHQHQVLIEHNAGMLSGYSDTDYQQHGAIIKNTAEEIFSQSEMILHVKELQPDEAALLRPEHILFTYLHLAANKPLTKQLIASKATCIGYENIENPNGTLPLLTPMSEVAGRLAVQAGAKHLEITQGGSGVLLGGVTGVLPGKVLILGGGIVGLNAAQMAAGLGAHVYILDMNLDRLNFLGQALPANCQPLMSNPSLMRQLLTECDLVIGAVLLPGAKTPRLVSRELLETMKPGSVMVDVAIDQGGCFETSKPTTHSQPTYTVNGIVHYCVANMPAAVAKTSTSALTNASLPYALEIANKGWQQAANENSAIAKGINISRGEIRLETLLEN